MKYGRLCKDMGSCIVFVPVFVFAMCIANIIYNDPLNVQAGVVERCVSLWLGTTMFLPSTDSRMSSGS